jgi:hypothetical protein
VDQPSIRRAIIFGSLVTTAIRVLRSAADRAIEARRREQLLACADALANLAEHRSIEPRRPSFVEYDLEIRRVLDTVVRRWSKLVPITYVSDSMTSARKRPGTVIEHVVPCRVLVDRMIMRPQDAPELLEGALVLARISNLEHSRLGGVHTTPKLYARMLTYPINKLPSLGRQRYRAVGIVLLKA